MIYEYCEEIQNAGINRNAFPSHCESYLEMGMYVSLNAIENLNNIYREAGIIELKNYKTHSAINEADEEAVKKTLKQKIKAGWQKAWSGIVAIWEKIQTFITNKMKEFNTKFGNKFLKIDFAKNKDKLNKAFEKSEYVIADFSELDRLEKGLETEAGKVESVLSQARTAINKGIDQARSGQLTDKQTKDLELDYSSGVYGTFLAAMFSDQKLKSVNGIEEAKKVIDEKINKQTGKVDVDYITSHKKEIYDIITNDTKRATAKSYHRAKVQADKAMKALEKAEHSPIIDRVQLKADLAYQNILLALAETRKKAFVSAIQIVGRCCIHCLGKKNNEGYEDKKEAKNESAIKYNTDFVNEVFNW